jgi:putative ABC transport system permease protein
MNFFKRATTSILRRPGKTVILLLLIFILGTVISGAIAVRGAVSNTDANLRREMRPLVTFSPDYEAHGEAIEESGLEHDDPNVPRMGSLTPDHIRQIEQLPNVAHIEYSISSGGEIPGMREFSIWSSEEDQMGSESSEDSMAWVTFRGTSAVDLLQVREGVVDLVDGRTFTEAELTGDADVYPIIVAAGFARVNGLSVNDTFEVPLRVTFPQTDGMWDMNWANDPDNIFAEKIFKFEIIGLIDYEGEIDPNDHSMENQQLLDRIGNVLSLLHLPNSVAEEMQRFHMEQWPLMMEYMIENDMEMDEWQREMWGNREENLEEEAESLHITSIVVLDDPANLEAFEAAAMEVLPDFWRVEAMAGGFDAISSSMDTLQGIAHWILIVSVGATLLILSLLITLFLRDRRYEMGVYLALGEKKGKIISQILLEVVVTAVVAITLAVFTGNMISGVMSRTMIRNELTASNNSDDSMHWGGTLNEFDQLGLNAEMSTDDMLAAFDVSLDLGTVGLFYAVGLGAVIFSTLVPVIYVVTLNPKKVLM